METCFSQHQKEKLFCEKHAARWPLFLHQRHPLRRLCLSHRQCWNACSLTEKDAFDFDPWKSDIGRVLDSADEPWFLHGSPPCSAHHHLHLHERASRHPTPIRIGTTSLTICCCMPDWSGESSDSLFWNGKSMPNHIVPRSSLSTEQHW